MKSKLLIVVFSVVSLGLVKAQTFVNTLAELQSAVQKSNQTIILTDGDYNIEDLPSDSRYFDCRGSNNVIDLRGVYIEFPVDATSDQHFLITGSDNVIRGGELENTYADGTEEVTDFVAYNNDRNNFANGGDPHVVIQGDNNKIVSMKMTVRGSFPYGYGSIYGINNTNQFGLSKRGGVAVQGTNAVIDSCELYMQAFGHGIYIQSPSNHTIISNTTVIGELRLGSELLAETDPTSLPFKSDFLDFSVDSDNPVPIDATRGISLCEDGIRLYNNGGSMEVTNCTVEKMRGGIRGYLGSGTTVVNSTSIDCESTNFNLPNGGSISSSYGNFSYCPLSDYRLGRSNTNVEITIMPSPHASGSHNILDLQGNNHDIVFHRTEGPLDTEETRAIVITGNNSTVVNETEYTIILESGTSGNQITSCGDVIDNGSNTVIFSTECFEEGVSCNNTVTKIEAECFDDMSGVQTQESSEGTDNVGWIENGDWTAYNNIDLTGMYSVNARVATKNAGGIIEVRIGSETGTLIGSLDVVNTSGDQKYETVSVNIEKTDGEQDVYFVYTGGNGYLFNVNWFGFSEEFLCNNTVAHLEAECFDEMSGVETEDCSEGTLNVGFIHDGDWLKFEDVDLTGINSFKARVASRNEGGEIEVRLDGEEGQLLGVLGVNNTGGWQEWVSDSVSTTAIGGVHDVYLVFAGGDGSLFNLNYIGFSEEVLVVTGVDGVSETAISVFPNPTSGEVKLSMETTYKVVNSFGQVILSGEGNSIDLSNQSEGMYLIQAGTQLFKVVKE